MGPSTDRVTISCVPWTCAACSIIRWHSRGQSCINPRIRTFLLIMFSFPAGLHGIGMNSSVEKARRKWTYGGSRCGLAAMVTAAAVVLIACGQAEPAAAARTSFRDPFRDPWGPPFGENRPKPRDSARVSVPLPRPRPAEHPAIGADKPADGQPPPAEAETPAEPAAPVPQLSACRLALTDAIAIAPSIPDIHGAGGCGGEDLVRLEAVMLPDRHLVSVKPAAILRCPMASAIADWVRTDIAPLAASLGS